MQSESSSTRLIPLTRGLWTLVDAGDYATLSTWKWNAWNSTHAPYPPRFYASHSIWQPQTHMMLPLLMHRVITGAVSGQQIDHANGDSLDNRRCNLRFATSSQNQHNHGPQARSKTGFKGVWFNPQRRKWVAMISANYHQRNLGYFASAEEAARAYDAAAVVLHGEFAWLNFPPGAPA